MANRTAKVLLAASFLCVQLIPSSAVAQNQMGYQLLSARQAAALPRAGGALGLDVGRAQQINSGGMAFELLRVKAVRQGSPAAQAGFNVGDQIIAADSRVFPSVAAFAAYVGSVPPGRQIMVDYMPARTGPDQAQRVAVVVGGAGTRASGSNTPQSSGMSTTAKLAIGVGAAALFGCYKAGCFSRAKTGVRSQR